MLRIMSGRLCVLVCVMMMIEIRSFFGVIVCGKCRVL